MVEQQGRIEARRIRVDGKVRTYADLIKRAEDIVNGAAQTSVEKSLAIILLSVINDLEVVLARAEFVAWQWPGGAV